MMQAQWGHFLLCATLALSCWQLMSSVTALVRQRPSAYAAAANAVVLHLLFTLLAFLLLVLLMVIGDYSVDYVAAHTNDSLGLAYRIAATWSAHEGSMLLWLLMLSLSCFVSVRGARHRSLGFRCVNLAVFAFITAGTTAFVLFSSNPFDQSLPPLLQGRDLNPLLQDPGLIFHPPLLYVGYVSTVIAFAAAVAALWCGELNRHWAAWLRPYALFSWIFLSCGIALGSYWAYYELGWGGWWFWDPVENASFMPWLLMTALVHALAASARTGAFLSWCALLAILTFGLSMLGTFLVRSGILVSVHSFASDPDRGIMVLALLVSFITPAIAVYIFKTPTVKHSSHFTWLSAESAILFNNLLLCVACATVFLGTMYPLALEVLTGERISVGTPYFNAVFVPLMMPLLAAAGLAGLLLWRSDSWTQLRQRALMAILVWLAVMAVLTALALTVYSYSLSAVAAVGAGLWVMIATAVSYLRRIRTARSEGVSVLVAWTKTRLGVHGMHLAHVGLGVFALAVALVSTMSDSTEAAMRVGESRQLGDYSFTLSAVEGISGTNYDADQATVTVSDGEDVISILKPQRRRYHSQPDNTMTEADIESRWFGDLFVALTEDINENTWGLRIQIKAGIYWIWLGVLMMAAGGALAMISALSSARTRT
ncbi:MAG: heme lyase CcmF/NrfE family subunit [Gammaproteobacteria bacterium]|nr:heme lyase CcmF/NrfE family subunit [Gammaproteobacteria bacterium]